VTGIVVKRNKTVLELIALIKAHGWEDHFEKAIAQAYPVA